MLRATVCCTNVYRLPVVPRMMGCRHSEQRGDEEGIHSGLCELGSSDCK